FFDKIKNMKKYFIIILAVCLIVLFIAFAVWLNPGVKNEQKDKPADNIGGTTIAYGVKMQNKCFVQFEDFIKVYGADYLKCLAGFNYSDGYCGGFDPDTQRLSDINIIVILDSSGSMAEKILLNAKIDIAKKAISDFLIKMPQGVKTGLVVYGHKGSNSATDRELSCKGIEEVVKLGRNNYNDIVTAMDFFDPKGWTSIAGSLDFAKNIFNNNGKNNKNYLILVSDGTESCDGDPLAAAKDLKLKIQDIKLIVIGFAADSKTNDFLKKIAEQGGGLYLAADNSSDIAKVFNDQLVEIKNKCIEMAISKASSMHRVNNLNNLNCWHASYKKESDDFTINILNKSVDTECNLEISDASKARYTEFWQKKQKLEEDNGIIYKKIESDLNDQLKVLKK
ncbi:MAG: VWA domain-containing protein, partial [bacterium]|nr:VWA domain-containing protein [bacterium]